MVTFFMKGRICTSYDLSLEEIEKCKAEEDLNGGHKSDVFKKKRNWEGDTQGKCKMNQV